MRTFTPSSEVGSRPLTIELFQVSVTVARLIPVMVNQEPGTMPGAKLALLATPFNGSIKGAVPRLSWNTEPSLVDPPPKRRAVKGTAHSLRQ